MSNLYPQTLVLKFIIANIEYSPTKSQSRSWDSWVSFSMETRDIPKGQIRIKLTQASAIPATVVVVQSETMIFELV